MAYIVFDCGGTKSRIAVSDDGENFHSQTVVKTPSRFEDFAEELKKIKKGKIKAVAGGIAGIFNKEKNKLMRAHNLPLWAGEPIGNEIKKIFNAPVFLENDAALAGLGEAVRGAGKNHRLVAYITIGTGVGGVRIVNSRIDEKNFGFEPGHQIVDINKGVSFQKKDLDDMISGAALERRYGVQAYKLKDPEIWEEVAGVLAVGLSNSVLHWSPDIVVLGGSLMKKIPIERVKDHMQKVLESYPEVPKISYASLDYGELYGALVHIKNNQNTWET